VHIPGQGTDIVVAKRLPANNGWALLLKIWKIYLSYDARQVLRTDTSTDFYYFCQNGLKNARLKHVDSFEDLETHLLKLCTVNGELVFAWRKMLV